MRPKEKNINTVEDQIKAEALRLGFSLCGITTPEPPTHFNEYLDWLAQGNHGEMHYLATSHHLQNRKDPDRLMPEAQAVISLAWSYPIRQMSEVHESKSAWVAGYASGDDYHHWFPEKMKALGQYIKSVLGESIEFKAFTDSAPILERELACRAGLGWIGKNACLISPDIGSTFLLGEILLNYPLKPDEPFLQDLCGTCTKCIAACPTSCILPNRTIDSRKCLSYQTIENKGAIPVELRPLADHWLFGCDICQMACPWNKKTFTKLPSLPLIDFSIDQILELMSLTPESFKQQFGNSAFSRTKWKGVIRNMILFLGNSRTLSARAILQLFLQQNPDPDLLEIVYWAIARIEN